MAPQPEASVLECVRTHRERFDFEISAQTGIPLDTVRQAVTATGRLQSQDPNLQNIPVRTDLGQEIRKAFVPRGPDYLLLSADYSQIELRIIAALSGDAGMMDAFASVISNNLNIVMKRLTVISIVLMIPTLVVSMFGMNVRVPFEDRPWAFAAIAGLCSVLALLGGFFLRDRKPRRRERIARTTAASIVPRR